MKSTVLITTYRRAHLLKWGLTSLANKPVPPQTEFVVLNDGVEDKTEEICNSFKGRLDIRYIFTGKNKQHEWRVPGFAINYGVKQTDSDLLFIACAEMYHIGNTLEQMVAALQEKPQRLTIPHGWDDNGKVLKALEAGEPVTRQMYTSLIPLHNVHLPFFMGMNRKDFEEIGGYDEDFLGCGWDDNDIVERMKLVGNVHHKVSSVVIHLWHRRLNFTAKGTQERFQQNQRLFNKRRSIPKRNTEREWGKL